MSLNFRNEHSFTAYVGVLLIDRTCSPTPWRKIGWYAVPPGGEIVVLGGSQRNLPFTSFAWYADTGANGPCWSGNRWYQVPLTAAYNQCYEDNTGCDAFSPHQGDQYGGGWSTLVIVLQEPGAANQESQGHSYSVRYP